MTKQSRLTAFGLFVIVMGMGTLAHGQQRFFAEKPVITFFSDGLVEDITAVNRKVTSIFDVVSGEVAYLMNVRDFDFPNKLMQTHFNEKYMETEKFPKSSFKGTIKGYKHGAGGTQSVNATGQLTIHGVSRDVSIPGTIEVNGNKLIMKAKFPVKLADYNITVPQVVWDKIAQQVEVTIDFVYRPL